MAKLTVISDAQSGSVFAACIARDEKGGEAGLAELVGSTLIVAVNETDLEIEADEVAADALVYPDLESVIRDPTAFWVKRTTGTAPGQEQVTLQQVDGDARLAVAMTTVTLSVPTPVGERRKAWLLVKKPLQQLQRLPGVVEVNSSFTTFDVGISPGDLLVALVEGHRPVLRVFA